MIDVHPPQSARQFQPASQPENPTPPQRAQSRPPVTGPERRRAAIVEKINAEGAVRTDELARIFGVSLMTAHRDLEALSRRGAVTRVRGGARTLAPGVGTQGANVEHSFSPDPGEPARAEAGSLGTRGGSGDPQEVTEADVALRRQRRGVVKQELARAAAELIDPDSVLALDDSTTVEALGPLVAGLRPSCVITHSLAQLSRLSAEHPEVPLIGLGGSFVPATGSFLGTATARQAEGLSADVAVVSTTSVRGESLYHPDEDAALTKAALIGLGRRRILICDSSKFGAPGLHFVARLNQFDDIVVDDHLPERAATALARSGARIHRIPVSDPSS